MESIIARQRISKRRSVPRPAPILQNKGRNRVRRGGGDFAGSVFNLRIGEARPPIGGADTQIGGSYSRGAARSRGLASRLAYLASAARAALGLHRGPPALGKIPRGAPRARIAIRIALVLAAGLAAAAGFAAFAGGFAFPLPDSGLLPAEDSAQNLLLDYVSPELADGRSDAEQDATALPPVPATLELSTYTVRSGDSLETIARRFGLYVDTIISVNGISSIAAVKPGSQLRVPNINGLVQKVRPGDSLASIAKRYKADATRIVDANDLGSARLVAGQSIFIPGARLPDSDIRRALGPKFAWPIRGPLSSFFGYRPDPFTGVRRFHAGIDIAVDADSPIRAAMEGKVADVGYNANYGNYVILSHADGFQTLYGHLTSPSVAVGTTVAQGSVIGLSGNTGYSTGPHLHFGIFRRSLPLNPLKFLK
jgi:murein DD-endopeptidase MepM/ murein hydrolase activator NlpD